MKEIEGRADIEFLISSFYEKATKDELIGEFFTTVIVIDWEKHVPRITDFWESVLFASPTYKGNPILAHQDLNEKKAITKQHFDRWVELFCETVDENFEGEKAVLAKNRGRSIATVMQIKL